MNITLALADDHVLFLRSLSDLVSRFPGFEVACEAINGLELLNKIAACNKTPDIVLVDVNMPVMDGRAATREIAKKYPQVKIVALSMNSEDIAIINMFKAGCCAYLLKEIQPQELEKALHQVYERGFYNAGINDVNFRRLLIKSAGAEEVLLTGREKEFLAHACTDLTYKEIADKMFVSERTVDGYREALFGKFNVKSRVGLAVEAIRRKLVNV